MGKSARQAKRQKTKEGLSWQKGSLPSWSKKPLCARMKSVRFCELMWQLWAVTSFSHCFRSGDVNLFLTEAFSPRRPWVLSSSSSHCSTLSEVCKEQAFCSGERQRFSGLTASCLGGTALENLGTRRKKRLPYCPAWFYSMWLPRDPQTLWKIII